MPQYEFPKYKVALELEVSFKDRENHEKGKTSQYILVDLPPGIESHKIG
jgi:hypothetical protein